MKHLKLVSLILSLAVSGVLSGSCTCKGKTMVSSSCARNESPACRVDGGGYYYCTCVDEEDHMAFGYKNGGRVDQGKVYGKAVIHDDYFHKLRMRVTGESGSSSKSTNDECKIPKTLDEYAPYIQTFGRVVILESLLKDANKKYDQLFAINYSKIPMILLLNKLKLIGKGNTEGLATFMHLIDCLNKKDGFTTDISKTKTFPSFVIQPGWTEANIGGAEMDYTQMILKSFKIIVASFKGEKLDGESGRVIKDVEKVLNELT